MVAVTDELVDRIVAIETANLETRLRSYAELDGNPCGVHLARFGSATAFVAERIPLRFYNSVLGTTADILEHLDEVHDFYRSHGVTPAFEIVPSRLTELLGQALALSGYAMVEFHAALFARCDSILNAVSRPSDVQVLEVERRDTNMFERFNETYLEGWGSADVLRAQANLHAWRQNETWTFYLAFDRGEPAGAAILDVRGRTALLGSASTRPSMRGRGVQTALLQRRAQKALALGCDLLVGGATFGTTSMRNQQRAGLQMAFTRGIWAACRELPVCPS